MPPQISAEAVAAINRLAQHLSKESDLTLIVLKGHLVIERQLRDIVAKRASPSEVTKIDRWSFSALTRVARAYVGVESPAWAAEVWESVDTLNALRNELAHQLESPKVGALAARLIELQAMADFQVENTMEEQVESAIALLLGRLTRFQK